MNKKLLRLPKCGFTLIEVLVVLSIVGILMAIVLANFTDARENARDKVRKSELKELQLALEVYKSQYGQYPAQGCGAPGAGWSGPGPHSAGWGISCEEYIVGLVPSFIGALPRDPNQENVDNTGMLYMTDATRQMYKVLVHRSVETNFVASFEDEFSRCPRSCGSCAAPGDNANVYGVYSLGAECW